MPQSSATLPAGRGDLVAMAAAAVTRDPTAARATKGGRAGSPLVQPEPERAIQLLPSHLSVFHCTFPSPGLRRSRQERGWEMELARFPHPTVVSWGRAPSGGEFGVDLGARQSTWKQLCALKHIFNLSEPYSTYR